MTNIVTATAGTFYTSDSLVDVSEVITEGQEWLRLEPSGTMVHLSHVVSITGDEQPNGTGYPNPMLGREFEAPAGDCADQNLYGGGEGGDT